MRELFWGSPIGISPLGGFSDLDWRLDGTQGRPEMTAVPCKQVGGVVGQSGCPPFFMPAVFYSHRQLDKLDHSHLWNIGTLSNQRIAASCTLKTGNGETYENTRRPVPSVFVPRPRFCWAGTARRPIGRESLSAGVGDATSVGDQTHRGSKECAADRKDAEAVLDRALKLLREPDTRLSSEQTRKRCSAWRPA